MLRPYLHPLTARCLIVLTILGVHDLCLGEEPDFGGQWLVIGQTEKQSGPGLVSTDPYSGLRPGYFVKIEGAFLDKTAALARLRELAGAGCGPERCYVRFTGERYQPIGLDKARAAAERASGGQVIFATTLSLRGRDIPLVITRSGPLEKVGPECPGGGEEEGTRSQVWLFWSSAGHRLTEWQGQSGLLCCAPWKIREAPERLRVVTAECDVQSCGAFCTDFTRLVAVAEDMPHEALAEELHCDKVVSAYPAVQAEATCDTLELSAKGFRLVRPQVRITPCPDDDNLVKRAEVRTRVVHYQDGLLQRTTSRWAPHMRKLWGCGSEP